MSDMKTLVFGTKDIAGEGTLVSPDEVGALIGKGARGAKKCISSTWKMYESVQASDKRIDEDKPSLKIVFHPLINEDQNSAYPEEAWVEVISESSSMQKLAQLVVKKHITEYIEKKVERVPNSLSSHEYVVDFPHHLLGRLIGKKAFGLNRILDDVVSPKDCDQVMIHEDDVETASTARIKIKELTFENESIKSIIDYVNSRGNRTFPGWEPSLDEKYVEHVGIIISFKRDAKPFNDLPLYLERFRETIVDRIQDIKSQYDSQMEEISECLGFD